MLPHLQARVALIFQALDQLVVSVTPLSVDVNAFKLKIELGISKEIINQCAYSVLRIAWLIRLRNTQHAIRFGQINSWYCLIGWQQSAA
jgi:hypothetical protein